MPTQIVLSTIVIGDRTPVLEMAFVDGGRCEVNIYYWKRTAQNQSSWINFCQMIGICVKARYYKSRSGKS